MNSPWFKSISPFFNFLGIIAKNQDYSLCLRNNDKLYIAVISTVHGFINSTVLSDDDFINGVVMDEYNNINGKWFIKFYAPWWGHCKHLAPTWEELADIVYQNEGDFHIGSVDCTENRLACDRFDIGGYPTLLALEGTSAYQFRQKREMQYLAAFIFDDNFKEFGEVTKMLTYDEIPKSSIGKAYQELEKALGSMFEAIGMGFIPPIAQILIATLLMWSPFGLICYAIMYPDEDYEEFKKKVEEQEAKEKQMTEKEDINKQD